MLSVRCIELVNKRWDVKPQVRFLRPSMVGTVVVTLQLALEQVRFPKTVSEPATIQPSSNDPIVRCNHEPLK